MSACPHCGREAPIVYRGVVPQCAACGGLRQPLSGPSVNLAGKPSRVGGVVASVIGWLVLLVGGSVALGLVLLFGAFHALWVGAALATPVGIVALVLGIVLVRRGGTLNRAGIEAERETRHQALLALAAHRGAVTATDAAHALGIGVVQADAMLTELAKREPERLAVDVDDEGRIRYRFVPALGERVRVEPGGAPRVASSERDDGVQEGEGDAAEGALRKKESRA
jgi:hypothetical protein